MAEERRDQLSIPSLTNLKWYFQSTFSNPQLSLISFHSQSSEYERTIITTEEITFDTTSDEYELDSALDEQTYLLMNGNSSHLPVSFPLSIR